MCNRHIKKLLSVLTVTVMLLSLVGCMDHTPTQPQNTSEPTVNTEDSIFPLQERKAYSIFVAESLDLDLEALQESTWYQELVSKTNVDIRFLDSDDIIASTEAGHAFIGNYLPSSSIAEAAGSGFFLPLDAFITESVMPNYTRLLAEKPGAKQHMTCVDGHIHTLSALDNSTYGAHVKSPLTVNPDWLKKAGLSDVNTIEKFEQYLKYVKENDVNGNGDANDEIPFLICASPSVSAEASLQGILSWWGLSTASHNGDYYCVITDGKVDLAPRTSAYRAAIEKVAQWYRDGYLWSEFFTGTSDKMNALLNASVPVVGAVTNSKSNTNMEYVAAPAPQGYTPSLYISPEYYGQRDFIGITRVCSEEDIKILLAWMDLAVFSSDNPFHETESASDSENVARIEACISENICNREIRIQPYTTIEQSEILEHIWADTRIVIADYEEQFIKGDMQINAETWFAYKKALYHTDAWDLIETLQEAYDATL